jgi:hypothetical protein
LLLISLNDKEMLEIGKAIVNLDVITENFTCDLNACKGACCVIGDSGAPLELWEAEKLKSIFPALKEFLTDEGVNTIEKQGTSVIDIDNDIVTPLIKGKECAYTLIEHGIARCGIEKAFIAGTVDFRKPVSCYLYPVRIRKYKQFDAVNYDRWDICKPAIKLGTELEKPVYQFVSEALIQLYGTEWFNLLEIAARNLEIERSSE